MTRQDNAPNANDRITTNLKNGPGTRNRAGRTKVKSGCATCRIRKIKCDENKPACQNCISTGRRCDGYELPFRFFRPTSLSSTSAYAGNFDGTTITQQHNIVEITRWDVELLSRHLSTKTIFNVNVGCDREARQLLQASLTDPTIRHALFSLRALRHDLETVGYNQPSLPLDITATVPLQPLQQHTYHHRNGLRHYVKALGGLASSLSSSQQSLASPEFTVLKSVLLCCQVFISIEQLRRNYIAMAQHIIRGLSIMRQYRVRPTLAVDVNELLPAAQHDELPLLDVFIIKLYIAPCKFVEPPLSSHAIAATSTSTTASIADGRIIQSTETIVSSNPNPSLNLNPSQTPRRNDLRSLAPNMRTELTDIGSKALTFLSQISTLTSSQHANQLQSTKSALLKSLSSWLIKLNLAHTPPCPPPPSSSSSAPPSSRSVPNQPNQLNQLNQEPISVAFLRFFHQILQIIVLGALEENPSSSSSSSPDPDIELQQIENENARLLDLAVYVAERVRDYRMPGIIK